MSNNKKSELRFFFSRGNNRSSPWRIWDTGNDLYVSVRNIGGLFKASLHESGDLNFSFTKDYYESRNIDPLPQSRHFGNKCLNISTTDIQIIFAICIPIDELSDVQLKMDKMKEIPIDGDLNKVIEVLFLHAPEGKRNLGDYSGVPNLLGVFCGRKYIITWSIYRDSKNLSGLGGQIIEFGDIKNEKNTRAITFGYFDDTDNPKGGVFIDRKI